jgi:two-component system response regulator MtrA
MTERVLLVEDDDVQRTAVATTLRKSGMEVVEVSDGDAAIAAFDPAAFDIVVLDLLLPGVDGFEVCRAIRERSLVPIVMVTRLDQPDDMVRGLELGADDYVAKPFAPQVLLARLRAVLRRSNPDEPTPARTIESDGIKVDVAAFRAWRDSTELELSATEFRLLTELVGHPGEAYTRQLLLERVWGYDYLGDSRLVDMAIKRLRDKIEDDPHTPRRIVTVRGIGYRFGDG